MALIPSWHKSLKEGPKLIIRLIESSHTKWLLTRHSTRSAGMGMMPSSVCLSGTKSLHHTVFVLKGGNNPISTMADNLITRSSRKRVQKLRNIISTVDITYIIELTRLRHEFKETEKHFYWKSNVAESSRRQKFSSTFRDGKTTGYYRKTKFLFSSYFLGEFICLPLCSPASTGIFTSTACDYVCWYILNQQLISYNELLISI